MRERKLIAVAIVVGLATVLCWPRRCPVELVPLGTETVDIFDDDGNRMCVLTASLRNRESTAIKFDNDAKFEAKVGNRWVEIPNRLTIDGIAPRGSKAWTNELQFLIPEAADACRLGLKYRYPQKRPLGIGDTWARERPPSKLSAWVQQVALRFYPRLYNWLWPVPQSWPERQPWKKLTLDTTLLPRLSKVPSGKTMKTALSLMVMLVLAQSVVLLCLWRENQGLRVSSTQNEQIRSDLAHALESSDAQQAKQQELTDEIARLQEQLHQTGAPSNAAAPTQVVSSLPSTPWPTRPPLGLTTNDLDTTSIHLYTMMNGGGMLWAYFAGKSKEETDALLQSIRRPVVFGRLVSTNGFGIVRSRDGTNYGLSLTFESRAEADAFAAELRGGITE
jgi:hypothetical protein